MIRYPALIDSDEGAYGVVFPDILGVGVMGDTVDEARRCGMTRKAYITLSKKKSLPTPKQLQHLSVSSAPSAVNPPRCQTVPRARIMQARCLRG